MNEAVPPTEPASRTASIMNRIVAASLGQPVLVLLLTLLLTGAGARSLQRLPVDAYPDLSPPIVEIITQWPGHTAEEVERLITVPVEIGMTGIPKTDNVRSISLWLRVRLTNAWISSAFGLFSQILSTSGCSAASARNVMP